MWYSQAGGPHGEESMRKRGPSSQLWMRRLAPIQALKMTDLTVASPLSASTIYKGLTSSISKAPNSHNHQSHHHGRNNSLTPSILRIQIRPPFTGGRKNRFVVIILQPHNPRPRLRHCPRHPSFPHARRHPLDITHSHQAAPRTQTRLHRPRTATNRRADRHLPKTYLRFRQKGLEARIQLLDRARKRQGLYLCAAVVLAVTACQRYERPELEYESGGEGEEVVGECGCAWVDYEG